MMTRASRADSTAQVYSEPRARRWRWSTLLLAAALLLAGAVGTLVVAPPVEAGKSSLKRQLASVRRATAKYHDVAAALADGYAPITIKGALCVAQHHGGAMGIHYLHAGLAGDADLDRRRPELLLYEPTANGLRLVAVEYFVVDTGQPHPRLFGRRLDGPNSTLEPEIPRHYSLHTWIWRHNPAGTFAPYNPKVAC
jgi:hypothetical protein